jgi:hypothetical protein
MGTLCTGDGVQTPTTKLIDAHAVLVQRMAELEDIARRVERWWIDEGQHKFDGAPECMFALRAILEPAWIKHARNY